MKQKKSIISLSLSLSLAAAFSLLNLSTASLRRNKTTPSPGQKRLTNIAVVRLKKQGKRFEVACYKNKVANWRSGVETDLDEVLQTEAVFSNVSRGVLAKDEDLKAVFGTTDTKSVCLRILTEGDTQVSDRERAVELGALFRDVAAAIASRCVNTSTRRPFTVSMVERALKDAGFSVDGKRPAKAQAGDAEALLASRGLPIERARMRLRAVVHPDAAAQLTSALEVAAARHRSVGGGGGFVIGAEEEEGGDEDEEKRAAKEAEAEEEAKVKRIVIESQDMSMDGSSVTYVFLAEPGLFREIHAAVEGLQGPGNGGNGGGAARLEVVDVAATDAAGAAAAAEAADRSKVGAPSATSAAPSASSVASGLRSLRMSPPPDEDADGTAATTSASSSAASASAAAVPPLYPRGPIFSLPAELAGARRKDLFDALDGLQEGWTVELLSRGGGSGSEAAVVDAVFYSPAGEKVGTFAAARRIALAASKAK